MSGGRPDKAWCQVRALLPNPTETKSISHMLHGLTHTITCYHACCARSGELARLHRFFYLLIYLFIYSFLNPTFLLKGSQSSVKAGIIQQHYTFNL